MRPAKSQVELPPEVVQEQLERIERSPEFVASDRDKKFFRYIVEEAVAGRGARIKAYSIATQVFERRDDFDPQRDPVVRIEAGRLRRALERYYLVAGREDPIVVTIPKGGYMPLFARRSEGEGARKVGPQLTVALGQAQSDRPARSERLRLEAPTLEVVPFTYLGDDPAGRIYALGMTEEVVQQLAKFRELVVLGSETQQLHGHESPGKARMPVVRYVLKGNVRTAGSRIRFAIRLKDRDTGVVPWSDTYDGDLSVTDLLSFQEATAHGVAAELGQPYGAVFRCDFARVAQPNPEDFEAYSCTLAYYAYRLELDPCQHASVRTALEQLVERSKENATAWALLSLVYLDEFRFGYNPRAGAPSPVERALSAANRAVDIDPENGRALQAQMLAMMFTQRVEEALAIGERALALNPNDVELLSEVGVRQAVLGDRKRGVALLERAISLRPHHARYYYTQLASAAFFNRDLRTSVDCIEKGMFEKNIIAVLMSAAIFGQAGVLDKARDAADRALRLHPDLSDWLSKLLPAHSLSAEDRAYFVEGLHKAGLSLNI